jgi:putative phosphoribosyl transferase
MISAMAPAVDRTAVCIPIGDHRWIDADVTVPPEARGVVVFAHGSGSSRHSPRNRFVAAELNEHRLATLLPDLLTPEEAIVDERTFELRFDIPMLTRRVVDIIDWAQTSGTLATLPVGLFVASTDVAAALEAAAERPHEVRGVVSYGGCPDLAPSLEEVTAPTLLIAGGSDLVGVSLNELAVRRMKGKGLLQIIPGATHLFEEPEALEQVAALASQGFVKHLH